VDELLEFWNSGVYYSRTAKHALGRLVRCVLVPLVCDLPAARQTAGFGQYNAKFFCSMCRLPKNDIDNLDPSSWPSHDSEAHRMAAQAWKSKLTTSARQTAFEEHSVRWSVLLDLPYWDPVRFTVIDSMHNHYLGLLKHHCRKIWGMSAAVDDADDDSQTIPEPSPEDIALAFDRLYAGTSKDLLACKRSVLLYLCSVIGILRGKTTKTHLVRLLLEWAGPTPGPRRDTIAAERSLLAGNSANTLKTKFNKDVFVELCTARALLVTGTKDDLIKRLIAWRNSRDVPPVTANPPAPGRVNEPSETGRSRGPRAQRGPEDTGAVLGRQMLKRIHEQLPRTELPSWVDRVPSNVGTKARGKLSADQWHIFCVVNLPIILIPLWGLGEGRPRQMLDNFMDLVTEVVIGGLLEMTEEAIQVYETVALRYLRGLKELYSTTITPNQHNSIHIASLLRLFGPLHAIRTFFSERMNYLLQQTNTNMHIGELESTYMKHACRTANLRVLLQDENVRREAQDLIHAFEDTQAEDRRGTRHRESTFLGVSGSEEAGPRKEVELSSECFKALVTYLNEQAGQERYVDIRQLRRTPGLQQLSSHAISCRSVFLGGVSFLGHSESPKDSNIIFRSPCAPDTELAGRILQIFEYQTRDDHGDPVNQTYLFVAPLEELSANEASRDPYRRYAYVGGRLCYDSYLPGIIIAKDDVIAHFARTPVD
ncbi:hypothetical protein C8Q73DRAFT_608263, partial [Cubamyces lactineus]